MLDPAPCWLTLEAMVEAERTGEERSWREFGSSQEIAWKTGTSYGYRDAWAVGVTQRGGLFRSYTLNRAAASTYPSG